MKIKTGSPNLHYTYSNEGVLVLFSYGIPVAATLPSGRAVRTATKYSVTTTKHINKWLQGVGNVDIVEQDFINGLV